MALIVEDGTGKVDAESYGSVLEANAYHAARGNTAWDDLDTDVKEFALRKATDYIEQTYHGRWKGIPASTTQALDWPRHWVYPDPDLVYAIASNVVPKEVKRACFELASRAVTTDLMVDSTPQAVVLSEQVGPLAVTYAQTGQTKTRYTVVERMLGPLLRDGSGVNQVTARLG